jgi:hypothetical protein
MANAPLITDAASDVPGASAPSSDAQNALLATTSRKIDWRWGLLAALVMSLLSLYPQIDLWIARGADWQGAYASMFYDEEVYAAYVNGLLLGRPRTTEPLQVDSSGPPTESLFSIQVVPPYLLVILASVTHSSVSQIFIALTPVAAFLATLMIFYLLALATGDERLAAAGALAVLLFGTLASRDSVLFNWLFGRRVASGYFLFLRRYQPAIIFPAFFAYIALAWLSFTVAGRKAWKAAIAAGAVLAALVFSYFFLWTAALAWLVCLVFVWLIARRWEWTTIVGRLLAIALFSAPALAVYSVMLTQRNRVIDEVAGVVFTHAPDLHRAPEWIAVIVILLLIWGAKKGGVDLRQPVVLLTGSLALMPFAVFNQQIITGRSLQPHHYEMFSANYLSLSALILIIAILRAGREPFLARRVPGRALALVAVAALGWGGIEAQYMVRAHRVRNVERDRFVAVGKRLAALAAEYGAGPQRREVVFSPNIYIVSDNVAAMAPQAPFWGTNVPYAAGLSLQEQQERFFQYLYYSGATVDALERRLTGNEPNTVVPLFGADRYWSELTVAFKPVTREEIKAKVRQYGEYVATFDRDPARHPEISYLVGYTELDFDFKNLKRWYTSVRGERIGPFTIFRVKPRDSANDR